MKQLRTDGVYSREPAGTRPVVLKIVSVMSAAFSGITMDQLFVRPLNTVSSVDMMTCAMQKVSEEICVLYYYINTEVGNTP